MKIRWKRGETPLFPLNYRKFVLPACEGLFPFNFWWEVKGWGHLGRRWEGQRDDAVKGQQLLHYSFLPGLPSTYLPYPSFKKQVGLPPPGSLPR